MHQGFSVTTGTVYKNIDKISNINFTQKQAQIGFFKANVEIKKLNFNCMILKML